MKQGILFLRRMGYPAQKMMKIPKYKKYREFMEDLIKRCDTNNLIREMITEPCSNGITLKKDSNIYAMLESFSEDDAMLKAILTDYLKSYPEEDRIKVKWAIRIIVDFSKVIRHGEYENNPYYKNIRLSEQNNGNFTLTNKTIPKYSLCTLSETHTTDALIEFPKLCLFDYDFVVPCLEENGSTWMSITPYEISTMEKPISEATGNVLTLGCGLGYYAYMTSEKSDVEHVTIIESSQEIIDIFMQSILPQFPHKEKISIIKADAFNYMSELNDGIFNYCFADIFSNGRDFEPYMKLKKICHKFKAMKMSFWAEEEIGLGMEKSAAFVVLDEFYGTNNKEYLSMPEQKLYDYFKDKFKNVIIKNPSDLYSYTLAQYLTASLF